MHLASLPLLLLCSAALPCQAQDRTPGKRPNIVFIMADELGYYELGHMGHPHIKTPNLDRMAAEGMRFTQCLAGSPLCAPTRAVLLTGKHSGHTSVRSNGGGTPLRAGEATIASVLKTRGYATGGYGKWGCGGRGSTGVPEQHGFDEFVGYYDQVHAHTYYPAYIIRNSEEIPLPGNRGLSEGKLYSHYKIVEAARAFIRANKDRPFFCYMPVTPPHGIFDIPDADPAWALYEDKPWPEQARRYAAMVSMLDRQVGELRSLLAELGLTDNTLLVFCGDNGGNDYFKSAQHPRGFHGPNVNPKTGVAFRGHKGQVYEGGLRIPMLACWPGRIQPGQVSEHLCYFPDVLPTLAELGGASTPQDCDGISIVPTLLGGGRKQARHAYLYWELGQQVAVREGQHKAVRRGRRGRWELYDLSTDPSEAKDLAAARPEVLARLQGFAKAAHEPVQEGEWGDRSLHLKDRAARGGRGRRGPQQAVRRFAPAGLIDRSAWKILRCSSENQANGKLAQNLIDGQPRSHWHTRFGDQRDKHPHEVLIDMGTATELAGFAYLARQDRGFNGGIARCEIFVGDDPATLGKQGPALVTTTLKRSKEVQRIPCAKVRGRYLLLRALSEVRGGPWASGAEFGALQPK